MPQKLCAHGLFVPLPAASVIHPGEFFPVSAGRSTVARVLILGEAELRLGLIDSLEPA
jgi:hypothetical protein